METPCLKQITVSELRRAARGADVLLSAYGKEVYVLIVQKGAPADILAIPLEALCDDGKAFVRQVANDIFNLMEVR